MREPWITTEASTHPPRAKRARPDMSLITRATPAATPEHALPFARAAQLAAAAALLALALLHVLSPELDPSWHMISEYAYGRGGPVLTLLFLCWAASCWCAAVSLVPLLKGAWAKVALVLRLAQEEQASAVQREPGPSRSARGPSSRPGA